MAAGGAILLGELVGRLDMLDVAAASVLGAAAYGVARLLEDHGPAMPLPQLRSIVAADCAGWTAQQIHQQCGVMFPGLPAAFPAKR